MLVRGASVLIVAAALASSPAAAESDAELCARTARLGNVDACNRAVAADRRDLTSRRHLALAYLSRNDYENTTRVHGEIVALAPDDHTTHFDFAAALATFWRYEEALEPLGVALRLDPVHGPTLRLAAILYEANRRHEDAFAVIRRGAEGGDRLQMFALSHKYRRGLGTPADPMAAFYWLERAAEHGHVTAMRMLRDAYRQGREGVNPDAAKAAHWAERQRREGHPEQ